MRSEPFGGRQHMVIVSGHLLVSAEDREAYLRTCVAVVEAARAAPGCLDFALSADLLDPGRINILERWDSQAAVEAFRGAGVGEEQGAAILGASVAEYDVAAIRPLS
ncbi:MAG TPA: antibiotic biosynthesis monooxygenase family protein [Microlunatus sp.]